MIHVEVNAGGVEKTLKVFPMRVRRAVADGMDHATRSFFSTFLEQRLSGPPGINRNPGGIFHRFRRVTTVNGRKVFLRQQATQSESVTDIAQSSTDPMNMSVEMYTKSKAAGIHETGGEVTSAKPMPVPLTPVARQMIRDDVSLTGLDAIKIGEKVFLGRNRRFGKPELLFVLSRRVRIPARLGFYGTWDKHATRRDQIMKEALDKAAEKL